MSILFFFKTRALPLNNSDDFQCGKFIVLGTVFWEDITESDPKREAMQWMLQSLRGRWIFTVLWLGVLVIVGTNSGWKKKKCIRKKCTETQIHCSPKTYPKGDLGSTKALKI